MSRKSRDSSLTIKFKRLLQKNHRPWDLINWVNKYKLLNTKALQFNGRPYIKLDNLWQALHQTFNLAQDHHINLDALSKIISKPTTTWIPFSHKEFKNVINKCNNLSTPRLNCILWKHMKSVVKNEKCLNNFVNFVNMCIKFKHWPAHFKKSSSIIIPKPNRKSSWQTHSIPYNL